MGPGDNLNPGVYFLIGSGTLGVYTRSGVYLDPALKRSYTVCVASTQSTQYTGMGNTDTLHPNSCFCSFSIPTFIVFMRMHTKPHPHPF